jgi:glutaredoxin
MKTLVTIFIILIFCNCSYKKAEIFNNKNSIAAVINSDTIYNNEIDSLIVDYVFNLKSIVLNQKINDALINQEAQKENLSKNDYLKKIGIKKDDKLREERLLAILDSIKEDANIKKYIHPSYFKELHVENLIKSTIRYNVGSNNVYFISDFNCPHCQSIKKEFDKIIKNNPTINFYYIYHGSYIDETSIFAYACDLQGYFIECYEWLYANNNSTVERNSFLEFANDLGMDMAELEMELKNDHLLKQLVANKNYLMKNGVNKVPCFIVNNKLLISGNPISYIQNTINHEFKK